MTILVSRGAKSDKNIANDARKASFGVEVVAVSAPGASSERPGYVTVALLASEYLAAHRKAHSGFRRILLVSANAIFQRDPFSTIPLRNGILLTMSDTFPEGLTAYAPIAEQVFEHMGVCKDRDKTLKDRDAAGEERTGPGYYFFRGPGLIDTGAVIGTAIAVEVLLAELLHEYTELPSKYRPTCRGDQLLSRLVWYKAIAERVPVTIPVVGQSPVVSIATNDTSLWSIDKGMVKNRQGLVAPIVLLSSQCVCCRTKTSGAREMDPQRRLCPVAVMAVLETM